MPQVRRAFVALVSVIAVVLGFAPAAFTQSAASGLAPAAPPAPVHARATTSGPGYWVADNQGAVFSGGAATFHGSTGGVALNRPIVGIAATPTRKGYWLVASDGGIFSFGDAAFHGSTGAIALNMPIVGMASTPTGNGYWLVASDGGIFAYGDAHFYGSTGAMTLNKPIVGMTSSPSGLGYTLVASDGGVFSFGDAAFHGSTGDIVLNQPIVGIASTPTGHGYWMVASDGGIFSFGDARFFGSTGAIVLNQPIVGMTSTPTGHGYWFVAADGGVFSFGDAHFLGSATTTMHATVVGMAASAPVPATKLAFTTEPGGSAAGAAFSVQPVVTTENAGGGIALTDTSAVTLAITTPGGATLSCTANPSAAVAGVARFADCGIDLPGTYTLTATDGTLTSAVSAGITITPSATQLAFTTQPSAAASGGSPFVVQPVVTVRDGNGDTVATDTSSVTLTLTTAAGATLVCTPATTKAAVAGVATFTGCAIDRASLTPYTLTATDGSLAPAVSAATTVSVGAASKVGFITQPSASTGGVAFGTQPAVAVQDAGGNTVTSANSGTITLSVTTPSAPVGAALTCTTSNGRPVTAGLTTAFAGCSIDLASTTTYTLHASDSVGGLVGTSAPFAITVGAATQLGFVAQPAGSTGGTAFTTQPRVAVQDAGGNTVTSANTGTVTLTITQPSDPVGAALTCTNATLAVSAGLTPTYAGCKIDLASTTTYTLLATYSVGGLVGTSDAFATTVGAPAAIAFSTQPVGAATNTAFTTQPVVEVRDAGGNRVTTDTSSVTLTLNPLNGALMTCTNASPLPTVTGRATFTGCQIDTSGTYTLHAVDSIGALAAVDSGSVVIP